MKLTLEINNRKFSYEADNDKLDANDFKAALDRFLFLATPMSEETK